MPLKKKQAKSARLLKQLVAPADFIDEEDGSTRQQPSPMPRDEGLSNAVVGASLLLLSDADTSNVGPRTEALPGPPQFLQSPLPSPQTSSQPASQPASQLSSKQKGKGRGKKTMPSLAIDPVPGRSLLSTTEVPPQGL